ncbi:MAG: radical SAM protein [Bacteroidales bacterium]|nr:radical SAM protein [Bacteroidales bacterium]MBN2817791.1 radical SAM protein [Bacteroidales bacterium]
MTLKEFEKVKIPVIEIFQSISGEGITAGNLVSFVRVAGCNLRCTWCDTKYSFPETGPGVKDMLPREILEELIELGSTEVICTGGEPLEPGKAKRYLPAYLAANDFSVVIETDGAVPVYSAGETDSFDIDLSDISYCMDIKCPGSGMSEHNLLENIIELTGDDELKFVVRDKADLDYALDIIDKYKDYLADEDIALNFSPVFGAIQPVEIVDFLKSHTEYFESNGLWPRLSLQIHKFVWPPHQRGV